MKLVSKFACTLYCVLISLTLCSLIVDSFRIKKRPSFCISHRSMSNSFEWQTRGERFVRSCLRVTCHATSCKCFKSFSLSLSCVLRLYIAGRETRHNFAILYASGATCNPYDIYQDTRIRLAAPTMHARNTLIEEQRGIYAIRQTIWNRAELKWSWGTIDRRRAQAFVRDLMNSGYWHTWQ